MKWGSKPCKGVWKHDRRQKSRKGKGPGAEMNLVNQTHTHTHSRRSVWLDLKEPLGKVLNEIGGHVDNSSDEFCCKDQRNQTGARVAHESYGRCFCFVFYFVLKWEILQHICMRKRMPQSRARHWWFMREEIIAGRSLSRWGRMRARAQTEGLALHRHRDG